MISLRRSYLNVMGIALLFLNVAFGLLYAAMTTTTTESAATPQSEATATATTTPQSAATPESAATATATTTTESAATPECEATATTTLESAATLECEATATTTLESTATRETEALATTTTPESAATATATTTTSESAAPETSPFAVSVRSLLLLGVTGAIGSVAGRATKLSQRTLPSELSTGKELPLGIRSLMSAGSVFFAQVMLGATAALIVYLVFESNLLSLLDAATWTPATRTVMAFIAGFSEPFLTDVVGKVSAKVV